jgi:hypothetical protein
MGFEILASCREIGDWLSPAALHILPPDAPPCAPGMFVTSHSASCVLSSQSTLHSDWPVPAKMSSEGRLCSAKKKGNEGV